MKLEGHHLKAAELDEVDHAGHQALETEQAQAEAESDDARSVAQSISLSIRSRSSHSKDEVSFD